MGIDSSLGTGAVKKIGRADPFSPARSSSVFLIQHGTPASPELRL